MANYFVHVELVHDHECMWKDTTVSRVYPVWQDGTYEPPRVLCGFLHVELTNLRRELKEYR